MSKPRALHFEIKFSALAELTLVRFLALNAQSDSSVSSYHQLAVLPLIFLQFVFCTALCCMLCLLFNTRTLFCFG